MMSKFTNKIYIINASDETEKLTGSILASNVYLLGVLSSENLIPLKEISLLKAIEEVLPEKIVEINKKLFQEAKLN